MFSLRDLRFLFCSLDLDVLRAQRSMGFFILITHKSTRSESSITWMKFNFFHSFAKGTRKAKGYLPFRGQQRSKKDYF